MVDRLRPWPVFALAVWSLVLWTGRLGLAWGISGSTTSKVLATVPVVLFVALGISMLVVMLRRRGEALGAGARRLALVIAAWTGGYWLVRLPMILTDSHAADFKAVHTVLAVVSWAIAVAAWRSVSRPADRAAGPRRSTLPVGS